MFPIWGGGEVPTTHDITSSPDPTVHRIYTPGQVIWIRNDNSRFGSDLKILVIKSRRKPHTLVYEDLFYVVCFKNVCSVFLMFVGRFVKFVRTENNLVAYVFKILCLFRIRIRVSKMLCPDLDRIKSNLYPEQCNAGIWHSSIKFFL